MKLAIKGNKQLKIDEKDILSYMQQGFDIYSEDGKTLEKVGAGRTVPYSTHAALKEEYEKALKQLEDYRQALAEAEERAAKGNTPKKQEAQAAKAKE